MRLLTEGDQLSLPLLDENISLDANRYLDRVCTKHPELNGLRIKSQRVCVQCRVEHMAKWGDKNKDHTKNSGKLLRSDKKEVVISHYGGRCEVCGISDVEVLTIDHIWDDGAEHRKTVVAPAINHWLISNDFPAGFRLLCHNCNHKAHQAYKRGEVPPMSLSTIQREISGWADANFPGRDAMSVYNKLGQELEEWSKAPDDASEFADVMILVLDWAYLKGVNMQEAINKKMGVNLKRQWIFDSLTKTWQHISSDGVSRHA